MSTFLGQNRNHGRRHDKRAESEEDYHTFVTRLEKKTSMIDGPYFGNMQHAFKRVEVYEEVDDEFESTGPFGKATHMGRVENKGREKETDQYFERKQDCLIRS